MTFLHETRTAYDTIAEPYAERFAADSVARAVDRGMLGAFAEPVHGRGPVLDVGCGPGQPTAFLHGHGVDISGIDLSPGMRAHARAAHPEISFREGSTTALDVPDDALPGVLAGFRRTPAPGGPVLLAFQVGDEPTHHTDGFGQAISLVFHRRRP